MEVNIFWNNVNSLIRSQNKTQKSVSLECGFSERRIQNLSASNRLPDAEEAFKIAKALGTTVEFLVSGRDYSEPARKLEAVKLKLAELNELI